MSDTPPEPGRRLSRVRLRRIPSPSDIWRFFRHLLYPTRGSTLRGAADGLLVSWTLKTRGVTPLLGATSTSNAAHNPIRAALVSQAVDIGFAVLPIPPTCLRRSLTLIRELNRLDLAGNLHIGVRTVDGAVEAHAWIQVEDEVVNDNPDLIATYSELAVGKLDTLMPILQ